MKQIEGWWDSDLSPHLEVFTPDNESLDLVVDSGFNGELMLSVSLIKKLNLKRRGFINNQLADGSIVEVKTYVGEIFWFGQRKRVLIQATNSDEGLLGTELFQGCKVELDPDAGQVLFRKKSTKTRKGSFK